ncbi:MAG: hypothetical protein EBZ89_14760 [Chloroflexi bacterium]|nr:hypothetical protein [Chloroflexota bacterium]
MVTGSRGQARTEVVGKLVFRLLSNLVISGSCCIVSERCCLLMLLIAKVLMRQLLLGKLKDQ